MNTRINTTIGFILFCLLIGAASSVQAQENRWIHNRGGKWEDGSKWSQGIPPNLNHTVAINNGFSTITFPESILVDATSATLPNNMVINALKVGSGGNNFAGDNVLNLNGAGLVTPLTVLGSTVMSNKGVISITGSILDIRDGLTMNGGSVFLNANSILNVKGNNYPIYDFAVNGSVTLNAGSLMFSNFFASGMAVGDAGQGILKMSGGFLQIGGYAFLDVGAKSGSVGAVTISGGTARFEGQSFAIAALAGSTGSVMVTGGELFTADTYIGRNGIGQMTISNGIWRANPFNTVAIGQGNSSRGMLVLAGGTSIIDSAFNAGLFVSRFGSLFITGGELQVTNKIITIEGFGAISNGTWRAKDVFVPQQFSTPTNPATLLFAGGSTLISSNLQIGPYGCGGATGIVRVVNGNLIVTNATATATLGLYNGTLRIEGGTVIVDKIIMTGPCARFERTGGTLIYKSAQLDPERDSDGDGLSNGLEQNVGYDPLNPVDGFADYDGDGTCNAEEILAGTNPNNSASQLRVRTLLVQGDDIRIRWTTAGGRTNAIQAASTLSGSNDFTDIAYIPVFGSGDKTNTYVDADAAKQWPSRFYRVKLVP